MYTAAFGHAFEVEKDVGGAYQPASSDQGGPLLSELRLHAFCAALEHNVCDRLILVGGYSDALACDKAEVIADMLPTSLQGRIEWYRSEPHTLGNTEIVAKLIRDRKLDEEHCCCITNFYHVPRLQQMLHMQGSHRLKILPAESILLWTDVITNSTLVEAFRGSAPRLLNECAGIADLLAGTYRT